MQLGKIYYLPRYASRRHFCAFRQLGNAVFPYLTQPNLIYWVLHKGPVELKEVTQVCTCTYTPRQSNFTMELRNFKKKESAELIFAIVKIPVLFLSCKFLYWCLVEPFSVPQDLMKHPVDIIKETVQDFATFGVIIFSIFPPVAYWFSTLLDAIGSVNIWRAATRCRRCFS